MDSDEIIEMDELVIVGSRYSKDLKERLQPVYEAGKPMSAEELGRLLKGDTVVISPDMVNQFDPYALDVRTQENKLLGRVWWYQSFAVSEWMENRNVKCIKARIKRVNTKYGLIFAEVRGMKLTCRVRDNFSIDTDWANFIPDRLPCCGGSSLEVSMFLLRECLLEKDVDMKQMRLCFDNLLQDLPADLSAQNYEKCMELNQLMKNSPNAEVREMRDLLLHTFVERGSEKKMELWVNRWLSELFRDAAESELLAIFKAANYTLERVEELLNRAPGNLFYLYQVNRVRFAFQLYYLALPKEVYNRLLTLLAVRELMLEKEKGKDKKELTEEILARGIENCQEYFWANSAYAVPYCICRDDFKMTISYADFEEILEKLPFKKDIRKCPAGTIANAFSDNPIFNEHIDTWEKFKPMTRIIKLRDALRKELI